MVNCIHCGKTIPLDEELRVDTEYWKEGQPREYYCGAQCSNDAILDSKEKQEAYRRRTGIDIKGGY